MNKKTYRKQFNFDSLRILDTSNPKNCPVSITPQGITCKNVHFVGDIPDEDPLQDLALFTYVDVVKINSGNSAPATFMSVGDYKMWRFVNGESISFQFTVPSVWKEQTAPHLVMKLRTSASIGPPYNIPDYTASWSLTWAVFTTPYTYSGVTSFTNTMPGQPDRNIEIIPMQLTAMTQATVTLPCVIYGKLKLNSSALYVDLLNLGFDIEVARFGLIKPV